MPNKNHPIRSFEFNETIGEYNLLTDTKKMRKLSYVTSALAFVPALFINIALNFLTVAYMGLFTLISPTHFVKRYDSVDPNNLSKAEKQQIAKQSTLGAKASLALLLVFSPLIAICLTAYNSIDIFKWLTVKNNYLLNCCRKPVAIEVDNQFQSTDSQVKNKIAAESPPMQPANSNSTVTRTPVLTQTTQNKRFMTIGDLPPANQPSFLLSRSTANNKNATDDSKNEPKKTGIHTIKDLGR